MAVSGELAGFIFHRVPPQSGMAANFPPGPDTLYIRGGTPAPGWPRRDAGCFLTLAPLGGDPISREMSDREWAVYCWSWRRTWDLFAISGVLAAINLVLNQLH